MSTSTTRTWRAGHLGHQPDQAGQVEHVLEALAHGLQHASGSGPYRAATWSSRGAALALLPQAACAGPGRRRGSSRARAAHSRKRAANSAELADLARSPASSISSASRTAIDSPGGSSSVSGSRTTMPSSRVHRLRPSRPSRSRQPGLDGQRPRGVDLRAERASARTPASRRARRGSARPRMRAVVGQHARWPRAARRGRRAGCRRRQSSRPAARPVAARPAGRRPRSSRRNAPMRRPELDRPARARRRARTAACRAGRAPG